MATPQEAKPDASSELPGDSPDIAGNTAQPQANASAPSTEAIKADPPLGEASSHDTAGRAAPIEMVADAPSEAAEEPAAAGGAAAVAAPSRSSRFALLAASLALAAGLGAVVGSLSASGLAHFSPVAAAAPKSGMAEANALQAVKAELAEFSALKASLDGTARNANSQFAKIVDRLDRVERAQIEPAAKIAHMAEAIDRLEKKNVMAAASAAPETTGAISNKQPAAPAEAKLPDKILENWVVQDVRRGRALVENSYGGVFAVAAGSVLPGLGVVESIKRQDGQWVVVTARGVITEH
ncbi:MAG: hypothetical protein ABSF87_07150 [Xanthobacteraceae bacterium]|jgi:hypothetical protein